MDFSVKEALTVVVVLVAAVAILATAIAMTDGNNKKAEQSSEQIQMAVDNVGLKEPLATLPNGVKDTRDGNTVTRRVGKKILDGDAELYGPSYVPNVGWAISIKSPDIVMSPADGKNGGLYCVSLPTIDHWFNGFGIAMRPEGQHITITLKDSMLNSSKNDTKTGATQKILNYLKANPITVWYELETPYTETVN